MSLTETGHAALMDGVYRRQRHFYDLTRKYYLLGRDELIESLDVPHRGSVLELGCGTGRNLVHVATRYPTAWLYGLDISSEMLATAEKMLAYEMRSHRVMLARGDATGFDANALFHRRQFDRIFVSYSLSMIPGWQNCVEAALAALKPDGSLHIVDFGDQAGLPGWFRTGLRKWLRKFHVEPRGDLIARLSGYAHNEGRSLRFTSLYRDYAWLAVIGSRTQKH